MIEMVDHLGFIERHIDASILMPPVRTSAAKSLTRQLFSGAETTTVVRHIKQSLKRNSPRILSAIRLLPDQHGRCPIQLSRQVTVGAGAEQGRRQRVRVHQPEIPRFELDLALLLLKVLGIQQESSKARLAAGANGKD